MDWTQDVTHSQRLGLDDLGALGRFIDVNGEKPVRAINPECVHELSSSQKASIFGRKFEDYQARDLETQAILRRLKQYSPPTAACFASKASRTGDFAFRLLSRAGRGFASVVRPSFITLSYRWAEPFEGEATLPLPPLLWAAASQELQSDDEGLWVDQVCIRQSDEVEKTLSIGLMDMIYEEARCTVVVLTDVEVTLQEMEYLGFGEAQSRSKGRSTGADSASCTDSSQDLSDPIIENLVLKLLESNYFQRVWCSHEYRLSADHVILCSCAKPGVVFRVPGKTLVAMAASISTASRSVTPQRLLNALDTISSTVEFSQGVSSGGSPALRRWLGGEFKMLENFEAGGDCGPRLSERHQERTAYRDKLAIALNSVRSNIVLLPEPYNPSIDIGDEPANEHARKILLLSLARRENMILCCMASPLPTILPSHCYSWLNRCELASYQAVDEHEPFENDHHSQLIEDANDKYIKLQINLLRHRTKAPQPCFIKVAAGIMQVMLQRHNQTSTRPLLLSKDNIVDWRSVHEGREEAFELTLACVLELGIPWCMDYLSHSYGVLMGYKDLSLALAPLLTCQGNLACLNLDSSQVESDSEINSLQRLLATEDKCGKAVAALLNLTAELIKDERCWETWSHFTMPMYTAPGLVSIDNGASYRYLMFCPRIPSSKTPVRALYGIPAALTNPNAGYGHRVWTLGCVSAGGDQQLSLLHKVCLFGPPLPDLAPPRLLKIFGPPRSTSQLTDPGSLWGLEEFWRASSPETASYAGVPWKSLRSPRMPLQAAESVPFNLNALLRSIKGIQKIVQAAAAESREVPNIKARMPGPMLQPWEIPSE